MTHSISGKCIPTVSWEWWAKLAPFFSGLLSHAGNRWNPMRILAVQVFWGDLLRIPEN